MLMVPLAPPRQWLRRYSPLWLYRVSERSMQPTFQPGDVLLGTGWLRPRHGKVVVAKVDRLVIKRVTRITEEGVWLAGDNASASVDSRQYGAVNRSHIQAVILARIAKG